jgi:hypothetical protein
MSNPIQRYNFYDFDHVDNFAGVKRIAGDDGRETIEILNSIKINNNITTLNKNRIENRGLFSIDDEKELITHVLKDRKRMEKEEIYIDKIFIENINEYYNDKFTDYLTNAFYYLFNYQEKIRKILKHNKKNIILVDVSNIIQNKNININYDKSVTRAYNSKTLFDYIKTIENYTENFYILVNNDGKNDIFIDEDNIIISVNCECLYDDVKYIQCIDKYKDNETDDVLILMLYYYLNKKYIYENFKKKVFIFSGDKYRWYSLSNDYNRIQIVNNEIVYHDAEYDNYIYPDNLIITK